MPEPTVATVARSFARKIPKRHKIGNGLVMKSSCRIRLNHAVSVAPDFRNEHRQGARSQASQRGRHKRASAAGRRSPRCTATSSGRLHPNRRTTLQGNEPNWARLAISNAGTRQRVDRKSSAKPMVATTEAKTSGANRLIEKLPRTICAARLLPQPVRYAPRPFRGRPASHQ